MTKSSHHLPAFGIEHHADEIRHCRRLALWAVLAIVTLSATCLIVAKVFGGPRDVVEPVVISVR